MPDLGEQALSKVAEIGIASQLDEVENLDVSIQTDPLKVMTGTVDTVEIQGEGLVMNQDLRVEEMRLETQQISINPLSVAFGKIELTQPTDAEAHIVLTEADINRAFNSDFIQEKLKHQQISVNGKPTPIDPQKIDFRLLQEGKFAIRADVRLPETGETQQVAFTALPQLTAGGACITLAQIEYANGQGTSPELTQAMVQAAQDLLDLRNFELEGMSLRVNHLQVESGKLILQAAAAIEQFPS